jgi:steroid delta-isomerase-like uncharacterized protein
MMKNHRRKEILTQFTREVWSNGDIEASGKFIASKYTIHHDPSDPWEGRDLNLEGYKERVKMLRASFPDQLFDIQGLFADGNAVVMTWLWSATHKGDLPGFPATGKQIKMSGATVYYFDDEDRFTGHWQITDRLGVFHQLREAVA